MASLPYVTAPGSIDRALIAIKAAATPERVSFDFVKTVLLIPGGSGTQINSFLKKIGFVKSDGTPSDIYRKFRNPSTSGRAAAEALKFGYGPLYARNEYMHRLPEDKLRGLIIEETGKEHDASVVNLILAAVKAIKKFADFSEEVAEQTVETSSLPALRNESPPRLTKDRGLGLNLSYTINLNLPATPDIAVFNAIFRSLKENLLVNPNED